MRTKKILLSLLLMFGMILGFMPMTAVAAEADDAWTSYAASEFAGGSGTKEDPYQIKTAEQLAKLASEVNSGVEGKTHSQEYFKLMNSLDLMAVIIRSQDCMLMSVTIMYVPVCLAL